MMYPGFGFVGTDHGRVSVDALRDMRRAAELSASQVLCACYVSRLFAALVVVLRWRFDSDFFCLALFYSVIIIFFRFAKRFAIQSTNTSSLWLVILRHHTFFHPPHKHKPTPAVLPLPQPTI